MIDLSPPYSTIAHLSLNIWTAIDLILDLKPSKSVLILFGVLALLHVTHSVFQTWHENKHIHSCFNKFLMPDKISYVTMDNSIINKIKLFPK